MAPHALVWILFATLAAATREPIVFDDVAVVDVDRGRVHVSRAVLVEDGRIAAIGAAGAVAAPSDARRVDGRGRFLVPGLVDLHVHLFNNASGRAPNDWAFALFVAHGVTGVREMAARPEQMAQVREWNAAVDAGGLLAPRVLAAGVPVRGDSPEDAARRVGVAADARADFIKVFSDVPAANWRAIVDAARARGLPVAGHVPDGVSLLDTAEAGQRSAEHLTGAFEACAPRERFDARRCARIARALARAGQLEVPTLVLDAAQSRDAPPESNPLWTLLRADEQARWRRLLASATGGDRARAARSAANARLVVAAFHRAHVAIGAGTDAPMPNVAPGASLLDELDLLVAAGLSPADALRAATIVPARFLGREREIGAVAPGLRADLLLLDADPLRSVRAIRRPVAVVVDGTLLTREDLDVLLRPREEAAK